MAYSGPKVFGIGLPRTGTTSLDNALKILGCKAIHAPLSIIRNQNGQLVLNVKAAARYEAITDFPAAIMYKQLDIAFPRSKFILTVRNEERWVLSMRRVRKMYWLLRRVPKVEEIFHEFFGASLLDDEVAMAQRFLRHTREVRTHFSGRNNLLVMHFAAGDGWQELCNFLGRPEPSVPFPHQNNQTLINWGNVVDSLRGLVAWG
jgi:hypothetical protein